ncbi:MAG: arsenate reductase (glutaredoxin) [Woeseiaceae bacterium]|nr:arsenate reductase (glutaredoxin) [Woeseiaceae bacterium]
MSVTIYHNPRCSKSRKTLEILEEAGTPTTIVRYLDEPPSAPRIAAIAQLLGLPVQALLRRNESEFKDATDLPDLDDDAVLADWISRYPKALERPIVVTNDDKRAVIGRPPENVRELID